MFIAVACVVIAIGLLQVLRPQLLWGVNRRLQRGWVKDPDATEPTRRGYLMQRAVGVVVLVGAIWILVSHV
ncbi:hypothetical protein K353_06113 [Kitasatospora sp. SolWspMP-SS2h]|uniref:DUF6199 family natural product biosynthesis protein n=1 Tax=Kitasatospora sp. SolWspMP-SS2h TaxID=1305729 RepID=UPI000DBA6790|nr:DUF6199 family natural product biosynthesis protein [Kitasatospora sp. SolWspMP-SS2h]RAJ31762.1 hypothetical protein K353_06113 [Kitasatospora sp. SolWspMP-SS2h]